MTKLLFIEDDKVDQMGFKRLVRNEGLPYDYTITDSVTEANKLMDMHMFDIIVTDYLLCDGIAFDVFGRAKGAPIIVITGHGDQEIAVTAMKKGAYDYLVKDNDLNYLKVLPAVVKKAIKHRKTKKAILELEDRERQRIGMDLHDNISQLLLGISFKTKMLYSTLKEKGIDEAGQADDIGALVNNAINEISVLSKGALIMADGDESLMDAFSTLALNVKKIYGISCNFNCEKQFKPKDRTVATHLYRIVQEAVNNAIKHANAKMIDIVILQRKNGVSLTISDDGKGIRDTSRKKGGLGLRTMKYRAGIIGAKFNIQRDENGGTVVTCIVENRQG